jgi:hypothetical protein
VFACGMAKRLSSIATIASGTDNATQQNAITAIIRGPIRLKDKDKIDDPSTPDGKDAKLARIRHALDSLPGVVKEICRVYREMRADELDHTKGRSLVWVLSMLRAAIETQSLERLEARLEELAPTIENRNHGYQNANRPARTAH